MCIFHKKKIKHFDIWVILASAPFIYKLTSSEHILTHPSQPPFITSSYTLGYHSSDLIPPKPDIKQLGAAPTSWSLLVIQTPILPGLFTQTHLCLFTKKLNKVSCPQFSLTSSASWLTDPGAPCVAPAWFARPPASRELWGKKFSFLAVISIICVSCVS